MALNGISLLQAAWSIVSGAHTEEDIEKTIGAFDLSLTRLRVEEIL
jgi:glutamate-1-semialdehyde aminotransferase